jgi:hypothetical protein
VAPLPKVIAFEQPDTSKSVKVTDAPVKVRQDKVLDASLMVTVAELPSMSMLAKLDEIPELKAMLRVPLKLIVSPADAEANASLREPAPESASDVTVNVAADETSAKINPKISKDHERYFAKKYLSFVF